MNVLSFETHGTHHGGRFVRRAVFERRSTLAVSAACVVANGIREILAALLNASVTVRLMEPVLPDAPGWEAIAREAQMFGVRGPLADAAIVMRPADAMALATAAFGESAQAARALSTLERTVLFRAVNRLAPALAAVCGVRETFEPSPLAALPPCTTYFEVWLDTPVRARIGIALSREAPPVASRCLRIEDLLDVELDLEVEMAAGPIAAAQFLTLRPGSEVPMTSEVGDSGALKVAGVVIGAGTCGVAGARHALTIQHMRKEV
jgi:flagellar motor switch/type III secretory pathway protein FliN